MLDSFGSCRVCLVEIDGRGGTPASCTTPVGEGMVVRTQSERLDAIRRGVMELYVSDHPTGWNEKAGTGASEFDTVAKSVGLTENRYGVEGRNHVKQENGVAPGHGSLAVDYIARDESNPYFTYDPAQCIVCSRCVRACEEVQGTFALTIEGRGFELRMVAGMHEDFIASECVSCGACVQACPTDALREKSVLAKGMPERSAVTTCAYCGVGCSFKAEVKGDEVIRMMPYKEGKANHGHSCVKGRFAYGYATHKDRILSPMIREKVTDPWREVSWEEAIAHTAKEFRRIQYQYGRTAIGGITSSRCTNEETYLVQKLVRQGFRNNNVDTCARVCHSPTGYGLGQTYGTSAGTQDFDSVDYTDVAVVIGANPASAHPVFASRLKKRLRQGAKLIVLDPRRTEMVKSAHIEADYHLPLKPGTNVAVLTALAHVIVTEGLFNEAFIRERCDWAEFQDWASFVALPENSPETVGKLSGVDPELIRGAARLYATGGNGAIYYGLGVTEHSQGSTTVMAIANLAMATGNIGRPGVGVNPLRGQNNVQGSCDMGSFPHELPGYRHISGEAVRDIYESLWGVKLDDEPGLRIPNMLDAAVDGTFKGIYIQGEDILQSDPDTKHVAAGLAAMECVVVHDLFLNETANYAHVFLPGSTFLEKDGTFTNAERRINMVRKVLEPKARYADWEATQELARAIGLDWNYQHPSEIMDEIAKTTPSFAGVSFELLDRVGSVQWPCNEKAPLGTPIMHVDGFVRGKGKFIRTEYVATDERTGTTLPAAAHHRPHPVAVQCRRTDQAHRQRHVAQRGPAGDPSARCREPRTARWRLGPADQPLGRDDAARADHRPGVAGRGLHDVPSSGHAGQRHHHRLLRLGDQLSGIQGDRGAGRRLQRPVGMAARL